MRRFFQLRDDVTSGRRHTSLVRLRDGREPRLAAGIQFDDPGPLGTTVTVEGDARDFETTAFNVPIATQKLADAISAVAGSDVQVIPLLVDGLPGLCVLNAVRVIRCVDEMRSKFRKWTKDDHRADKAGQYRELSKIVLDAASIPSNAHFFRIEGWRVALVVSDQVKTAMERAGCTGTLFLELNA